MTTLPTPVYPDHIRTDLAESRRQAEARDREARASAVMCGWCGKPITNEQPCCGAEPWRQQ